jgi:RNA polymerase sigma factor (sigma-70 family)
MTRLKAGPSAARSSRAEKFIVAAVYQATAIPLRTHRLHRRERLIRTAHYPAGAGQPWKGHAVRDDPSVIALVARVRDGDQGAWNEIIERYSPLVWSICVRYQLSRSDIDDVGQSVWLMLVERIGSLRDPAALPGWLATTTRRECFRILRVAQHDQAGLPPEDQMPLDPGAAMIEQEVIAAERNAALRAAFAELPPGCHDLLSVLMSDPPCSYAEVSATLGMPVGSIGPRRARCLDRLRRSPHLAGVLGGWAKDTEVTGTRGAHGG